MTLIVNGITGIQSAGNVQTDGYLIGDGSQIQELNVANANLTDVSGNLIPSATNTYSLGNATNQFLDLWVSNSTIYLNNVPLTVDGSNNLLVDSEPVVISSNTAAPVTANIATTANVIAGNVTLYSGGSLTFPDGSTQTTAYDNDDVNTQLPLYSGNLPAITNLTVANNYSVAGEVVVDSSLSATGNVYGNNIYSYLLTTGTLTTPAQPNITNVGIQSTIAVDGNTTANGLAMTGNVIVNNLNVTGNINYPGNVLIVYGNRARYYGDSFGFGAWYAGIQSGKPSFIQTTAQFGANYNDYAQINFQNVNTTGNATTDYIVAADNYSVGNQFYAALGTASSSFVGSNANPLGNLVQSNDGYLYVKGANSATQGGNLIIGTNTPGRQVKFLSGAGDSSNILMSIGNSNVTINGTLSAQYFLGDGSNLSGLTNGNRIHFGNSQVVIANVSGGISLQIGSNTAGNIGLSSLSFGNAAGQNSQGNLTVAIGSQAGQTNQGLGSVAIGQGAANNTQGTTAVAIGQSSGLTTQQANAIAIGTLAGFSSQGIGGVGVGYFAGGYTQGVAAVAVGQRAGYITQGTAAVAIGQQAGYQNQPSNSIVLSAAGPGGATYINGVAPSSFNLFFVYPTLGTATQPGNALYYNSSNAEIQYGPPTSTSNYSSFNFYGSGTTSLGASQLGGIVQIGAGATVYVPAAASVPVGSKYKFIVSGTGSIAKVFCQGGEFIYMGNRQLQWMAMLPGEILELTSRGPGSVEWDVTGGTASMKYLNTGNGGIFFGYTWKGSIGPNSPPSTPVIFTSFNPSSNSTTDIQIQFQSNGYAYIACSTGTINFNSAFVAFKQGGTTQYGGVINNGTVGSGFIQLTSQNTLSQAGDTYHGWIEDTTNQINYRVMIVKRSTDNYASICIERLS